MSREVELNFDLYPKQRELFDSQAREVLYGGSAGGGKSHVTRVSLIVWCLQIPGLQCYLFRREFADLKQNHLEGPTGLYALLDPLIKAGTCRIVEKEVRFKNGSKIYLCHCQYEKDVFGFQGAEMHVLCIEESTQFSEFMIRYLRTRLRAPKEFLETLPDHLQGLFPRIIYTTNPGGASHSYFKRHFVDAAPPMQVHTAPEKDGGMTRQYIPARLWDNPSLDAVSYAQTLSGVSEEYRAALLNGDWNATVGSFYPEFDYEKHIVPDFEPPRHWARFRSFDWGSSAPFAVYWWAVADGENFDLHGTECWMPRGAIVAYREWSGHDEDHLDKGIGMRNEDIAAGILARSVMPYEKNLVTLTDSLPFQDRGGKTIAETFADCGVVLTQGDTSRIPGHSQVRARLRGDDGFPMIYFVQSCIQLIRTIPTLQHDPKKPEEHIGTADHWIDCVRLACMARAKPEFAPPKPFDPVNLTDNRTFDDIFKIHVRTKNANANLY